MMSGMKLDVGDSVDLILVDVAEDKETVVNFMTGLGSTCLRHSTRTPRCRSNGAPSRCRSTTS